ncbi:murein peptide amidase A [Hydrogenovibrio crunogenus]|uniref:Murein peptide amidase A n=1 Tax=Hydrogenovibrio crunogenus TaxID=39765 RepID=A0A4P7P0W7_9GAMM|nr:M14 family zinc carboxypeptidase [Hydrogenovibrio crunogenus]QBZ83780.1 murein peptide amidase A [Hydrogenovibrio crunogenus]
MNISLQTVYSVSIKPFIFSFIGLLLTTPHAFASIPAMPSGDKKVIQDFCKDLSKKLRTVKYQKCLELGLNESHLYQSTEKRPLTYREVLPSSSMPPKGRILFIGGIHGDEYAAISLTYLWLQTLLKQGTETGYHWLFLPLANPDGLFKNPATRPNANSVDLNRNFPSPDWDELALRTWKNHYHRNKRRYPGPFANSEPETQWLVELIERFQPNAIISIHAPYGLLDYDGPEHAQPNKIGHLKHRALGTYPGSLGRYAGEHLNIPVLTLELKSAGRMPKDSEIQHMLQDLENWVAEKIKQNDWDL